MKLLNISFHPLIKNEVDPVLARHKVDKLLFARFGKDFVKHLKVVVDEQTRPADTDTEKYFTGSRHFFSVPWKLYRYVRSEKPDVVFLHSFIFPFQVWLLRLFLPDRTRVIVQHHAELPFVNPVKRIVQKLAYRDLALYFFTAKELAFPFVKNGIIAEDRIVELMEVSTTIEPTNKTHARKQLGIGSTQVFVWVGRLNQNKDPLTLIKAIALFAHKKKDFRLYMIYSSSELEEEVKQTIVKLGIHENIVLLGKRNNEEVGLWLSAADYYVSASFYEGSGIALCESLGCGAIPIVTDIPSFRKMTRKGECAYLYKPGNEGELAQILLTLPPVADPEKTEKSRQIFKEDLSPDAISAKLFAAIKTLS